VSHSPVSWDHYRTFLAVADTGSLSAAARQLGLTQPTVGRQIDTLEARLGLSLFVRSPGGLGLTEAGQDLLPDARAMAAAAAALDRSASAGRDETRGIVRITASEIVGGIILPPMLVRLREVHPGLTIELALTNQPEDLLRRDADIAVRMMKPSQNALVARRIGEIRLGLFAHGNYVARHGAPADLGEISQHAVIGFDRDDRAARSLGADPSWLTSLFRFRCDSDLAQMAALKAGLGIGVCQRPLARSDPDLVPILEAQVDYHLDMWLVMHEDQRRSRRIRAVFDHLVAELLAYADL
jgi:DNA-binding transcriptional LysR family regulator